MIGVDFKKRWGEFKAGARSRAKLFQEAEYQYKQNRITEEEFKKVCKLLQEIADIL